MKTDIPIAIDCDGTILEHRYPKLGPEVPLAFRWLHAYQAVGAKLILYTMRSHKLIDGIDTLQEAIDYCETRGIKFWGINTNPTQAEWTDSPKTDAKIFIDDHAYGCPLIYPIEGGRPMVDWEIVGPKVMQDIIESPRYH